MVQVIGLRAQPIIMNNPVYLDGAGNNLLENYGAPGLTGAGWIFKFAFEREGVHSIQTLVDELHGIVLNGGKVKTKGYRGGGKVKKMMKGGAAGGKKPMMMKKGGRAGGAKKMTVAQLRAAAKKMGYKVTKA